MSEAVSFVGLAKSLAVFGIRAAVDLHEMLAGLHLPAHELSAADMYYFMAGVADGDYLFELLDGVFFVVRPDFVRFQAACFCAAYHAPAARAGVSLFSYYVPAAGRQKGTKIGIPTTVGHKFKVKFHIMIITHFTRICKKFAAGIDI